MHRHNARIGWEYPDLCLQSRIKGNEIRQALGSESNFPLSCDMGVFFTKKIALAAIFCHFPSVCLMRMTPRMTKWCEKYGKQKERKKTLCIQTNP